MVHDAQTDVFELQLPVGAKRAAGLAVAAALREALAERLGAEVREIGLALGTSTGPAGEARVSIFLHDRAAGGAGLVTRLAEPDWFSECVARASERLNCPQECSYGCPACVLRPDLNFTEQRLTRPGGLALVTTLRARLDLPDVLRVLGPETRTLGHPLPEWLDRQRRAGALSGVHLFPAWPDKGLGACGLADSWPVGAFAAGRRDTSASGTPYHNDGRRTGDGRSSIFTGSRHMRRCCTRRKCP